MQQPARLTANVRSIVEYALMGGDLMPAAMAADRMLEGIRGHQMIQQAYAPGAQVEVPMKLTLRYEGLELTVQGRIDGLYSEGGFPVVEEIKTTQRSAHALDADEYPVHWAQAYCYAHMLCEREGHEAVLVRLLYLSMPGGERARFERMRTRAQLRELFDSYLEVYAGWLRAQLAWQSKRQASIAAMQFPYDDYRQGQRDMAGNVYTAIRAGKKLLCQAPTGTGKTIAALFPALKALGEGRTDRVFYLTARTTVRLAALAAMRMMQSRGLCARSVVLTAREKICAHPGTRCHPDDCPRARGFFDRLRDALYEALDMTVLSQAEIETLAEKHTLCPFELGLSLSELAEVVIGDYNYAFDPRVRLKRFFMGKSAATLLVDEAHNLPDRARDMLRCDLSQAQLTQIRRDVGKQHGRTHALYRALTGVLRVMAEMRAGIEQDTARREAPDQLAEPLAEFCGVAEAHLTDAWQPEGFQDAFFAAVMTAQRLNDWDENFCALLAPEGKSLALTLFCLDPSPHLRQCMKRVRACVLFSATLSPMEFYGAQLGLEADKGDALLSLPSPFPPENLCVLRMPVATHYRARAGSMEEVARALCAFVSAKPGNYLACFPSYAYLAAVREAFSRLAPHVELLTQARTMDESERERFVERFAPRTQGAMLAFIAMGGVFSEGIDLPGERLSGAAIVGVGLPQVGLERDALKAHYEEQLGRGFDYAYTYPGLCRVLQAAGRVIRAETDRGALLLLDQRFFREDYEELMPTHWQVRTARGIGALRATLDEFWARE